MSKAYLDSPATSWCVWLKLQWDTGCSRAAALYSSGLGWESEEVPYHASANSLSPQLDEFSRTPIPWTDELWNRQRANVNAPVPPEGASLGAWRGKAPLLHLLLHFPEYFWSWQDITSTWQVQQLSCHNPVSSKGDADGFYQLWPQDALQHYCNNFLWWQLEEFDMIAAFESRNLGISSSDF